MAPRHTDNTVNSLEENVEDLCDLGLGKGFFDKLPKSIHKRAN